MLYLQADDDQSLVQSISKKGRKTQVMKPQENHFGQLNTTRLKVQSSRSLNFAQLRMSLLRTRSRNNNSSMLSSRSHKRF